MKMPFAVVAAALMAWAAVALAQAPTPEAQNPICAPHWQTWERGKSDGLAGSRARLTSLLNATPSVCGELRQLTRRALNAFEPRKKPTAPAPTSTAPKSHAPSSPPAPPNRGGLGGLVGSGTVLTSVRGFVLARDGAIPKDAIGYAVAVFTSPAQADRFCDVFRARLDFAGSLQGTTKLTVTEYGQRIRIAPFIWPTTTWPQGTASTCANLVANYDFAGARVMLRAALAQMEAAGAPADALGQDGPYLLTAPRKGAAMTIFDLSVAPPVDYDKWLLRAVEVVERGEAGGDTPLVRPGVRDQVRFVAFGLAPVIEEALGVFLPGYAQARAEARKLR
jgi:hypothetical protein